MARLAKIGQYQVRLPYFSRRVSNFLQVRRQEIMQDVRNIGADSYDILLPETHCLAMVTEPDEPIVGIVYGRYRQADGRIIGRGALVATDRRVLLVDRKPVYIKVESLTYDVISGVSLTWIGFMGTVTLHTRTGDTHLRTFNQRCATIFVDAIESRLEREEVASFTVDYARPRARSDKVPHILRKGTL